MKTLVISNETHEILKNHCIKNKIQIGEFVEDVVTEYIKYNSELPQILKNSNETVDVIICNYLSVEYKNSMPKELTLLRNTKDGTGFIGNYKQV